MPRPAITPLETSSLGNRSHVISLDGLAIVVDPPRDLDRVEPLLDGLDLTHVLETHIHNDYVTGGLALARATGAEYVLNAEDAVAFDRVGVRDGQVLEAGGMRITAVATPGHTPTHLSYVVSVDGEDVAVLTGGSLLYGTTGRTDLITPEMTRELAIAQHRSAHLLASRLKPEVQVLPTHGFGSFCSAGGGGDVEDGGTIADEQRHNPALQTDDAEAFAEQTIAELGDHPSYYRWMGPLNAEGPAAADLSLPEELDESGVRRAADDGAWLIDLRSREAFAAGHLPGAINVESTGAVSTYVGWILPALETPIVLLGEDREQIATGVRELSLIGVDHVVGMHLSPSGGAGHRVASFDDLREAVGGDAPPTVLDVRRDEEHEEAHVDGALHIPLGDLPERLEELPEGPIWVHCASGFRASIGASLVAGSGREVVAVDDDFADAQDALADADLLIR